MAIFQDMVNGLMRAARKIMSRRRRINPAVTREAYDGTLLTGGITEMLLSFGIEAFFDI